MIASIDYAGIAAVITAVAVLVSALGGWRTGVQTHKVVKSVDKAVNGKPPGSSTMVAQVQGLYDERFPRKEVVDDQAVLPLLRQVAADVEKLKEQSPEK